MVTIIMAAAVPSDPPTWQTVEAATLPWAVSFLQQGVDALGGSGHHDQRHSCQTPSIATGNHNKTGSGVEPYLRQGADQKQRVS